MCFHMDYICPFVSFHFPISRKFVFYCKLIFSKLQEVYFSSLLICSRHIATTPMITPTTIPAPKAAHAILSSPLRFSEYTRLLMILCREGVKNVRFPVFCQKAASDQTGFDCKFHYPKPGVGTYSLNLSSNHLRFINSLLNQSSSIYCFLFTS